MLYGVEPELRPEAELAAARRLLDDALPGSGELGPRYRSWLESVTVPREAVLSVLRRVADVLRERTRELVGLPSGESVEIREATGEPWRGFSGYRGDLRSRFSYNVDVPLAASEVPFFVAHEAYPGHHAEDSWKDAGLVRKRQRSEFTVNLAVGVQPVIAEGIAQVAPQLVADEEAHQVVAEAVAAAGVAYDAAVGFRVASAVRGLSDLSGNLTLLKEDGATRTELFEYQQTWSLQPVERVARTVDLLERRPFPAYAFCYTEGYRLCAAFVAGDAARFGTLLKEQLALEDLSR